MEPNLLSFDRLEPESIVIEFRYPFSFLFWDNVGTIYSDIREALPDGTFETSNATPATVTVIYRGQYEIKIEPTKFAVSYAGLGVDVKDFVRVAMAVYDVAIASLELEIFERIGLRQVFIKKYPSMKKVVEAISKIPVLAYLVKPLEHRQDKMTIRPSATVRMEDEIRGTTFALNTVERIFEASIPPIFYGSVSEDQRSTKLVQSLISFDIDTYTRSTVLVSQFQLNEWIAQERETVRRDAAMFF